MIPTILLLLLVAVALFPFLRERMRKPMDAEARKTAPGQFTQLSRGLTHYRWVGPVRGPIAVCVHGLTTPSFVWDDMAEALAGMGYRVLVYDLYGRGYSDRPGGAQDSDFFTGQLNELLEDQNVGRDFTLLGYSMGGSIVTRFAAEDPTRIRQLVLLAPAGIKTNPGRMLRMIVKLPVIGDWLMALLYPYQHARVIQETRNDPLAPTGFADQLNREIGFKGYVPAILASLRGILSKQLDADHAALKDARLPVLAVWGRLDETIPLEAMGRLTQINRDTRQEVIDTAGHGLTYSHVGDVLDAMKETLRDGLA